jgi:hypothetical protein
MPVMVRTALLTVAFLSVSTMSFAEMGTPEQRDACGPDVRKFCYKIKEADGSDAYLQCLELNRCKLSTRCLDMLKSYGK